MSDEIVVGCGASALTHLYYATQTDFSNLNKWNVTVIGQDDLWNKIANKDPDHRFGQPPQIVTVGGKRPTVDINPKDPQGFQTAVEIKEQLRLTKDYLAGEGVKFVYDDATQIRRAGNKISVETKKFGKFEADRVIVATGFGRSALPKFDMPTFLKEALSNAGQYKLKTPKSDFNLIMGGTEYLWASDIKAPTTGDFNVAIQGSSATSSWVVLRALELNKQRGKGSKLNIVWISRSGFGDANPAGRNSDVLKMASDNGWLVIADIKGLGYNEKNDTLGVVLKPVANDTRQTEKVTTLGQAYQDFYKKTYASNRALDITSGKGLNIATIDQECYIDVHHFVYALGADPGLPGGAGWLLSKDLQDELDPVLDTERRFDDDPSATTLGFKTSDEKVWVVGSAAFRGVGIKDLETVGKKYSNIAKMMCEAGSPPEGIAAIIAGAKALTGWKEDYSRGSQLVNLSKLNVHVADFKEIENWVEALYKFKTNQVAPLATKRVVADQIVALRKHTVFGLSAAEVDALGDPNSPFWTEMFTKDQSTGKFAIDMIAEVPDGK